jgi:phage terminase large subunit-like protein
VIGAASRDQATILFDQAAGFVRRSEGLRKRVVVKRGYREIRSRRDAGRVRVLAADVDTADGVIPTLALVDELGRHRSAGLYGVFRDGLGPRSGQMVAISVAGDHEQSPLGLMRSAARQLPNQKRTGRYLYARSEDGAFVLHEWALDPDDDVSNMRIVKLANPASWQTLELLAQRHDSPSMLSWQWARFACGLWVGADAYWISADDWTSAKLDDAKLEDGDVVAIGFDGSRTSDATALVACRLSDGLIAPLAVFEPPENARADWEVPGDAVDAAIARTMERYRVARGYFDPPLWQSEIDEWSREFGETAVMRFQTNRVRMQSATERFRTDLVAGRVVHDGDETLTRHVLNAQVREARGGYWLTKSRPGSPDKIDAAVAAVLAYEARADAITAGDGAEKKPATLLSW